MPSFQSHCGAIGAPEGGLANTHGDHFQSHCGAIGAWTPTMPRGGPRPFQSHCGAIGAGQHGVPVDAAEAFQSHCGAIGATVQLRVKLLLSQAFNPTVVRLGPATATRASRCWPLSIPLWCDWGNISMTDALPANALSIPLWCDWGQVQHLPRPRVRRPFNPTVVRLGPALAVAATTS